MELTFPMYSEMMRPFPVVTALDTAFDTTFKDVRERFELPFEKRVQLLAERLEITEFEALELFAKRFGMRAMRPQELTQFQPDFDLIGFAECQRKGCILGADQEQSNTLVLLVVDPEQVASQQIFEAHIERKAPALLQRALALRSDVDAFFESAEKNLRAMDSVEIGQQ